MNVRDGNKKKHEQATMDSQHAPPAVSARTVQPSARDRACWISCLRHNHHSSARSYPRASTSFLLPTSARKRACMVNDGIDAMHDKTGATLGRRQTGPPMPVNPVQEAADRFLQGQGHDDGEGLGQEKGDGTTTSTNRIRRTRATCGCAGIYAITSDSPMTEKITRGHIDDDDTPVHDAADKGMAVEVIPKIGRQGNSGTTSKTTTIRR